MMGNMLQLLTFRDGHLQDAERRGSFMLIYILGHEVVSIGDGSMWLGSCPLAVLVCLPRTTGVLISP